MSPSPRIKVDPMSSTIFRPDFRAGAFLTLLKCLTLELVAQAGHSGPGQGRYALPALKNRLAVDQNPISNRDQSVDGSRELDVAAQCCRT